MERGLIISNPYYYAEHIRSHPQKSIFSARTRIAVEPALLPVEEDVEEISALIAFYLGARTLSVKKQEISWAVHHGARSLIFFPDMSAVFFERFDALDRELEVCREAASDLFLSVYVPIHLITDDMGVRIVESLRKNEINRIVVGIPNGDGWPGWQEDLERIISIHTRSTIDLFMQEEEAQELEKSAYAQEPRVHTLFVHYKNGT